ncbi:MAG: hypothetical protein K2O31_07320 [Clostridia bacterium]|nr:hypothetical protein [Clostridia bacterium]MDE7209676.1 hypothetical protein [Clostridia bacterium]
MGIFKKKMSKEDIIAAINALSDDEQCELFEELANELEENDEDAQVDNEQEQETSDGKATRKVIEESESERVEAEDSEEVNSALGARISALEEQLADISERLEQMLSSLENKDFGAQSGGGSEKPAEEEDEAYIDAYYAKQQRRK